MTTAGALTARRALLGALEGPGSGGKPAYRTERVRFLKAPKISAAQTASAARKDDHQQKRLLGARGRCVGHVRRINRLRAGDDRGDEHRADRARQLLHRVDDRVSIRVMLDGQVRQGRLSCYPAGSPPFPNE